jgi:DNA-binding FadR family transcriptional regulator
VRLESLKRETLSSRVKENLKLYFMKNGLKGGDPIPSEHQLAKGLDVSRTALREALKSLESLGIIEVRPGTGRFLKNFNFEAILENLSYGIGINVDDFRDILDVRIALEGVFLERYAGQYSPALITELRELLGAMRRLAAQAGNEPSMIELHTLFHLALYRDRGNWLLLSLIRIFATVQRTLTMLDRYRTSDIAQFIALHEALVDAIEAGDAAAIRVRLLEHFEEPLKWSKSAVASTDRHRGTGSDHFPTEVTK